MQYEVDYGIIQSIDNDKTNLRKGDDMDILNIRALLRTKSIYDIPLRVTYYARVSSESDEQLNSLDNQIAYYEDLIRRNRAWTYIQGYVDEGLSGISTKKRKHFKTGRIRTFENLFSHKSNERIS